MGNKTYGDDHYVDVKYKAVHLTFLYNIIYPSPQESPPVTKTFV